MVKVTGKTVKAGSGTFIFSEKDFSISISDTSSGASESVVRCVKRFEKILKMNRNAPNNIGLTFFSPFTADTIFSYASAVSKGLAKNRLSIRMDFYANGVAELYVGNKMIERKQINKDDMRKELLIPLRIEFGIDVPEIPRDQISPEDLSRLESAKGRPILF